MFGAMEWSLIFLLAFTSLIKLSQTVRCYRCVAEYKDFGNGEYCGLFDGSERFIEDCPYSTVCLKKIVTLYNIEAIERRCAPQLLKDDQILVNKSWQRTKRIYEQYPVSCEDMDPEGRNTKTILCGCRGDLCNNSVRLGASSVFIFGLTVLTLFAISDVWL